MNELTIEPIFGQGAAREQELRALNNANASQTSYLTPGRWDELIAQAFAADCINPPASLLIAFDQDADYDSPNFLWFRHRLDRFVYVDRIVVGDDHRGRGLARRLYQGLFQKAVAAGHEAVVCEVNLVPPNPASDAFHARLGFAEMGRATLPGSAEQVRYFIRQLNRREAVC